jgi:cysteine desulfurase
LHFLEDKNIYVSSGSACAKGKGSHVLNEMGLSRPIVDSSLRISFSKNNTKDDINALCDAIKEIQSTLRKNKGVL